MAKRPAGNDRDDVGMEIVMDSMPHLEDELNGQDAFAEDDDQGQGDDDLGDDQVGDEGDQGGDGLGDEGDLNEFLDQQQPQQQRRPQQQKPQPQQQRRPQGQQPDPLARKPMHFNPNARLNKDAKGNILDQNGQIVARSGPEARIYERVHNQAQSTVTNIQRSFRAQMGDMGQKLQRAVRLGLEMDRELERFRGQQERLKQLNLSEPEQMQALQLGSLAKQNPLEAVKQVLTMAAARGIDLTSIGLQPGSFDPKAFMDLIRNEIQSGIKPVNEVTQRFQQQEHQTQVSQEHLEEAENQANEFFGKTPEALPFLPIFEKIVAQPQFATMPLSQIWDKIQLNLLRNRQNPARPGGNRQQRRQGNRQGPGLPSGQRMMPMGGDQPQGQQPADPSESYESIVRGVMKSIRR